MDYALAEWKRDCEKPRRYWPGPGTKRQRRLGRTKVIQRERRNWKLVNKFSAALPSFLHEPGTDPFQAELPPPGGWWPR